jgi:clan AA aspartic protease (TIGR02281 family)
MRFCYRPTNPFAPWIEARIEFVLAMGQRTGTIFAWIIGVVVGLTCYARGDSPPAGNPEAVFQGRGLTHSGPWLVFPAESEIHDRVWALKQTDDAVRGTTGTHRSLLPDVERGLNSLSELEKQRDTVLKGLDRFKNKQDDQSVDAFNNTITQADVLWSKAIKQSESIDGLIEREGQVEETRARYIGNLMDATSKAEALAAEYSRLSQDSDLTAAILQANSGMRAGGGRPISLGPSVTFSNDLEFLHGALKKIVSAWVTVQKTSSVGGLHVLPVLNGKLTAPMIWDSGCSDAQLSMETARALGLKITDMDPTVEAKIANGSKVKGKVVFLDSVQLGPFTLRHVLCEVTVDDQEGSPSPNLLGNSFQSHFLSRLDQENGRLQLTPIDSSVEIGTITEPAFLAKSSPAAPVPAPVNHAVAKPVNLDIARDATATASSTLEGSDPSGAIDGIVGGAPQTPKAEWACDQPTGWITLTWDQPVSVGAIKLWDRLDGGDHILSGRLVFDDGSIVPFGELPANGKALGMRFASRMARTLRVEILTVSPGTLHPGFAEISVFK